MNLSLDHVGVIAHDLTPAAARWERLGFTLAPLSRQRGAVPGQSGMQPWASANRCVILRRGYLELIGTVDAAAYNPWTRFLARFEGIHLLALRCADADAAYTRLAPQASITRLAPQASFLDPPIARERKLTYRGEERTMRFRNIFSRDAECPEGRYIVIEHQTPELLWQDELMVHENGALALEEAFVVGADAALAARVQSLDAIPRLLTPAQFVARFGWQAQAPCFAAISIAFADLDRTIRLFEGRDIVPRRSDTDVWLAPEHTNGFVMRLLQHA